jgi:uncharacterized membrane protein
MRTRVRALGHSVHPMLVVFPLGLFTTAVIFDLVQLITDNDTFSQVGFWNITAGAIGAVLAAVTGLADWTSIPSQTRAKAVGLRHGGLNAAALVLFVIVWAVRIDRPGHTPGVGMFILEVIALGVASAAAWLGGELVGRLGVGVEDHAYPNAPSSLRPGQGVRTGM